MPFNGSGTFSRLYSWVTDAANSINISSSRTDAEMNGFAAGLTNCVTRDGQSPPSADLPMGGKKLTNLGAATVATDALNQAAGDARYLQSSAGLANLLTFNNAGTGAASGATFGGAAAVTISYNSIGAAPLASPGLTGTPTAPTPTAADNTTKIATTAFATAAIAAALAPYAPLASPTFTGAPLSTTPAAGDSTTKIATTAFVDALRDIPQNAQTAAYTLALTDRQKHISITTGGVVIPANASVAFPIGATIGVYNDSGSSQNISITTDTLFLAGTATTGTRALAQHGWATLVKVKATTWVIMGGGIS